jgi:WD40 repeat protein
VFVYRPPISECAFSPDGNILIAASLDGKFYRWDRPKMPE